VRKKYFCQKFFFNMASLAGVLLIASSCSSVEQIPEQSHNGELFTQAAVLMNKRRLSEPDLTNVYKSLDENQQGTYVSLRPGVVLRVAPIRGAPSEISRLFIKSLSDNLGPVVNPNEIGTIRQLIALEGVASAATGIKQTTLLTNWTLREEQSKTDITAFFERQVLTGGASTSPWQLANHDIIQALAQRTADRVLRADIPYSSNRMVAQPAPAKPETVSNNQTTPVKKTPPQTEIASAQPQIKKPDTLSQPKTVVPKTTVKEKPATQPPATQPVETSTPVAEKPRVANETTLRLPDGQANTTITPIELEKPSIALTPNERVATAPVPNRNSRDTDFSFGGSDEGSQKTPDSSLILRPTREVPDDINGVDTTKILSSQPVAPISLPSPSQSETLASRQPTSPSPTASTSQKESIGDLKISIADVTGALGDGNAALRRAITALLLKSGNKVVPENQSDVKIIGTVQQTKLGETELIEITWKVEKDGLSIGQVVQENEVPAGMFDETWGENAGFAAESAQDGIAELLQQAK
jgi:hypothetical protein